MILLIDNYDSFTYNLVDYFQQLGVQMVVKRNDLPIEAYTDQSYEGLVLSPGPETPQKAGRLMEILGHYVGQVPILGICLGHQAIGEYFGASLVKALKPMHGKISTIKVSDPSIFGSVVSLQVVRYHSLVLQNLPEILEVTGLTKENEIMSIKHKYLPIWGLQYHPEAHLTEYGLKILDNWLRFNNIASQEKLGIPN
ncbi:anthranilate synthase component II [Penaeicola halotolerans]|uniref:anthranilate synthase component II n=1 Tax=Penaeicola halotolerans TaxID=2793196 RepID=UPI001CF92B82|nr:aminodeoxychorismate/anthranilate synthase component II [Penaeicola halotolerans]